MAYQVQYGQGFCVRRTMRNKKRGNTKKWIITAIVAVGIISMCIPQIRRQILPGDEAVTKHAADQLVAQIQRGESVVDAFTDFCEFIIQNG